MLSWDAVVHIVPGIETGSSKPVSLGSPGNYFFQKAGQVLQTCINKRLASPLTGGSYIL